MLSTDHLLPGNVHLGGVRGRHRRHAVGVAPARAEPRRGQERLGSSGVVAEPALRVAEHEVGLVIGSVHFDRALELLQGLLVAALVHQSSGVIRQTVR